MSQDAMGQGSDRTPGAIPQPIAQTAVTWRSQTVPRMARICKMTFLLCVASCLRWWKGWVPFPVHAV